MSDERETSCRLTVWLDSNTAAHVRRVAFEDGMNVSTWIRVVIKRALTCKSYERLRVSRK